MKKILFIGLLLSSVNAVTAQLTTKQVTQVSTMITTANKPIIGTSTAISNRLNADSAADKKRLTALEINVNILLKQNALQDSLIKDLQQQLNGVQQIAMNALKDANTHDTIIPGAGLALTGPKTKQTLSVTVAGAPGAPTDLTSLTDKLAAIKLDVDALKAINLKLKASY